MSSLEGIERGYKGKRDGGKVWRSEDCVCVGLYVGGTCCVSPWWEKAGADYKVYYACSKIYTHPARVI